MLLSMMVIQVSSCLVMPFEFWVLPILSSKYLPSYFNGISETVGMISSPIWHFCSLICHFFSTRFLDSVWSPANDVLGLFELASMMILILTVTSSIFKGPKGSRLTPASVHGQLPIFSEDFTITFLAAENGITETVKPMTTPAAKHCNVVCTVNISYSPSK